ncbi:DinB family protein [Deinococcus sp. KSM4-11]|uniref:DinB family protein n=1 Tax=Deinococcus sp. KSM4-11 TaxID=2568654 RepID=UPI0010A5188A|nr:DinB family protein [Deinococcus sp. KSM4-11]THF86550.1 DinB family protein [Deinococcus sp. KSM4-11]
MTPLLYGPPPETLLRLLGHAEFAAPERIVGGLDGQQAVRRPGAAVHSVAEVVAHLLSNMRFNLDLIEGRPASGLPDWPTVRAEDWDDLVSDFLATLERLMTLAQAPEVLARVIFPATDTEPGWTAGYKLAVNVAKHNAYHLGQIVVLRQLLGAWTDTAQ